MNEQLEDLFGRATVSTVQGKKIILLINILAKFMLTAILNTIRIFFIVVFFLTSSSTIIFSQTNVLMQHNDLKRTGWNSNETQLTQANVSIGNFGLVFARSVDDQIYAQPLIVSNLSIAGGTHNVVITETVNNSVYAFDADDSSVTNPYWHVNLTYNPGTYRPIRNTDMTGACGGAYTDFSGNMGIVGTPAIDSTTNTMYVVSRSVTLNGQTFVQYLHALDITTGAERSGSPVYITATYPGTGDGSNGSNIVPFDEQRENPRPGLLLYKGVVYISWASHCDWTPYHGWVIGYDASTLQQKYVYNDSQNGTQGGIWMSGQAPAVDDNGFIYISTGNGTTSIGADSTERGESLLKLSTASGNLKLVDYFTPNDYVYLNQQDLDYGVDGVMLIPNSNLSLSGSKESYLYLIDNTKMGGMNANNANVLQQLNINASSTDYNRHIHGSPVYYKDTNGNEYVYCWAEDGFLKQFPFLRSTMLFDTLNKIVGNSTLPNGMPGAMLALSSNGSQQGTGILWASHPLNGDANHGTVPGILQAFDASNVQHELWNTNMNGKRDSLGNFAKFVVPTIANGKVYMATFSNKLNVYGLNTAASVCANNLPSPWLSADVGYVVYPGDVCYDTGVFTITASGDDIWNNADAFHNVYQPAPGGNIEMIARVVSIQNTDPWAKCGIMFRSNLDKGSPNVFMAVTSGNGLAFQNRATQNGISTSQDQGGFNAPYWVRIVQYGNQYVGYTSANGNSWARYDSVVVALGSYPYISLAYTSHNNAQLGTAVVDNVSIIVHDSVSAELINFTAKNINNKYAQLSWTTTSEINTAYFEIERSTDTTNFQSIGTVTAQGASSFSHDYGFNDMNPFGGINYYRLKQVNGDSSFTYSKIVSVTFNFSNILIFPNPSTGQIYIQNNSNFSNGQGLNIEIINSIGQVLLRQTGATGNIITLHLAPNIQNDVYIVKVINSNGNVQAKKIFVRR